MLLLLAPKGVEREGGGRRGDTTEWQRAEQHEDQEDNEEKREEEKEEEKEEGEGEEEE